MAETRPTGEQLRFVSAATGEHILDAYLESAEKGGRQLPDMLADIYDPTTGLFRADLFEFRVTSDRRLQFRVGDFADTTTGWRDVDSHPYLFRPRGAWAQSTAYSITDIITYSSQTYICLAAHTSTTTFDTTKFVSIGSGASVSDLTDLNDVTITSPATGNILRYNGTEFVNYPDSNYAAASHTHAISAITNLQSTLDGKAASSHTHPISDITNLQTTLDGKAATSHSHAISDITNLQTTLDGKAAASHGHAISDITNLQSSLDAKLDDSQASAFGLSLLDDANAAAARTTLGLGTAALEGAGYFATAVHSHAISDVTNLQTSLDAKINTSAIGSTVQAYDADLNAIAALAGTSGFLKKTAANTWSLDTATYLTTNQTITLSGDLSGSGTTSISATIANGAVTTTKLGGDITTAGKALLDDADAAAQRTTLGLVIGTDVQAYDADLSAIAALTATSGLLRKTGANAYDLGSVRTKIRFITNGGQYVPSAGTSSIIVYLTGSGGAGGAAYQTGGTAGTWHGMGGSGGGTIIFAMAATAADTFQITIGAAPANTTASATAVAANGSASTFSKIVGTSADLIASAPGGGGGISNVNANGTRTGMASIAISAPNASYVAADAYIPARGGPGGPGFSAYVASSGSGGVAGGDGGGSFWGPGVPGGIIKGSTTSIGGLNSVGYAYGTGGSGGAIMKQNTTTTTLSAIGAAGVVGVCVIIEVLN